ncbi:response regulator [Microcoleus sp. FACHB-1515]|uniref:ATP-binding protein n=1 Tax=Cyanophyceae TaxID=3028117 RepID=UPI001686E94F|nr:ATP-binding protein [Microcoleus sp. FACHB-1515]MBD2091295.1 response regulator [Microcoleus sp. FACHB-1515]
MTIASESPNPLSETVFAGGGEMGALMRSHDWSQTPLGAIESWSPSLRTAVSLCLSSTFPISLLWGQELIQLYNDGYRPFCGAKHPQTLGRPVQQNWSELWHILAPLFEGVLQTGQPTYVENLQMFANRNGYLEETYFTFSFSPIRDESGEVAGVFHPIMETTAQVISTRRLRTLSELGTNLGAAKTLEECCQTAIATLSNSAADVPFVVLYLLQPDGKHLRQCGTTGWEQDWFALPEKIDLSASEELEKFPFAQAIQTKEIEQVNGLANGLASDFNLSSPELEQLPSAALVLPLLQAGSDLLTGLLIVGVNPRRPFDQDYQQFFELIAAQVTTALTNVRAYEEERLRAAREAARSAALAELDRAKTTFFSNVSHEFRTPLTLMLSPLEDALNDPEPLSPNQQQRIEVIQRNGLRLLKLVNTLLDFSRIESDRASAVYEPTDLATFTAELASVFRSAIDRAKLRLIVDCPPLPEPVYVDREMWEKIVFNLISNAFKFTFTGEITVRLQQVGDHVELAVQDTGIGIPAVEIPRLFERFHQVKGAQGRTFEGSGIGLSLVQELVKLHGGTIEVSSVEGSGSCFRVFIPTGCDHLPAERIGASRTLATTATGASPYVEEALRSLPQEDESTQAIASQERRDISFAPTYAHVPSSASSRILLVDDNADMREYVKRLLSQRWQVETAANGAIALEMIQQQLPDLVLTDVMMPTVDGFQLLKTLRADPITQSIPIILLSARAGEEATVEGLEAGADDYLIKPFSARELIARVETQLQMSRLRQELSANRFKNEFLMTVTHELQSPLATILGWARFLQTKSLDPDKTAKALAAIERNATIEAKLVKDLLDVATILSGKLRLKSQFVDLVALIQGIVTKFRPLAESKPIQLVEKIADIRFSNVMADGDRLKQVMANLLENAIKFTPPGGQVTIELERFGSEVEITVSDTGIGIHPDFLPSVFDRFTQAEVPSRHTPGGVGIGLAIARHLVELHGGSIAAASEGEGRGAVFTVRLPLIHSTQPTIEAPARKP